MIIYLRPNGVSKWTLRFSQDVKYGRWLSLGNYKPQAVRWIIYKVVILGQTLQRLALEEKAIYNIVTRPSYLISWKQSLVNLSSAI